MYDDTQKWSTLETDETYLVKLVYIIVQYQLYACADNKSSHINDTHNKEVYTTQVQVSMSTVPMQQVCPERVQNTSDKQ